MQSQNPNLFYKKISCISCGKKIEVLQVKQSAMMLEKMDEDTCPYYKKENKLFYDFYICPHCNVPFTKSFEPLSQSEKNKLNTIFYKMKSTEEFLEERDLKEALRLSMLTLLAAKTINASYIQIAGICTKIAWFNRYEENKEEEVRFLQYAYENYELAYTQSKTTINGQTVPDEFIIYILGEFSYRLEKYKDTRKWFSQLLTFNQNNKYVKKGKNRWSDIRPTLKER
ncbi:DUF2225 domain-containing protein [Lutibacter sp. B2]|nr:DUF2225 domain-containing protein [Lutibacter sp. B2]